MRLTTALNMTSTPVFYSRGGQGGGFSPANLFTGNETGVFYNVSDLSSMNTGPDQSGSVPAIGNAVGFIADKSGNGNHAVQTTAARRLTYQTSPDRATID